MKTQYIVKEWINSIYTVKCVKETAHYTWIRLPGVRGTAQVRKDGRVFDSFEEAKERLVNSQMERVTAAEVSLDNAQQRLREAEALEITDALPEL